MSPVSTILLFTISIIVSSSSHQQQQLQIECDFNIQLVLLWNSREIYTCTVHNDIEVTKPQAVVTKIHGYHLKNKEDQYVHGFQIINKNLLFFPRDIENFFYRLTVMTIESSKLSEIHQSDMTPFTNLKVLQLPLNELQYLEKDLFTYNPKLEVVNLEGNQIQNVHPDVFDYLDNLKYLSFEKNLCVNEIANDKASVKHLIVNVKDKCGNFDYQKLFNIEKFESSSKAEILKLKKLIYEKSKINENLTKVIEELKHKVESKHVNLRWMFMVVLMVVLVVLTSLIVGVVVFLMRQQRKEGDKSEKLDENFKMPAIPYNRSVAENIYEDIRPGRNEPVYDRLNHF